MTMTRDELADEVRAVMFLLTSEAALGGFDDGMLADAHAGLMAVIDRYAAEHGGAPEAGGVSPRPRGRSRVF
jgi:hypothetical protein